MNHNPPGVSAAPKGHLKALDGLRAVGILLVIAYHAWYHQGPSVLATFLHRFADAGWCGVDVFFAVSGYLITGILLDLRDRPDRWRTFFVRRTLRIFPLYYAVLAGFAVAVLLIRRLGLPIHDKAMDVLPRIWVNALYLSNFDMAVYGPDHVPIDLAWSLAIEEQFYLVYPFVLWRLTRPQLGRVLLASLVVATVTRAGLTAWTGSPWTAYALPFCRMDCLAWGCLAQLLLRDGTGRARAAVASAAPWLAVAALAGVLWPARPFMRATVQYGLAAPATAAWIVRLLTQRAPVAERVLAWRPLVYLGRISYSVYLFHVFVRAGIDKGPLRRFVADHFTRPGPAVLRLLLIVVVTLILSELSWRLFEQPILTLKDRLAPTSTRPRV